MAKIARKNSAIGQAASKKYRTFPFHTLEEATQVARKIRDENAGRPMNKLLLGHALGMSPSSSNFRDLLSSSYKYGLTDGTEKAAEIALTGLGKDATASDDATRQRALRSAAQAPTIFKQFFEKFDQAKVPSTEMLPRILSQQFGVPDIHAAECATLLMANGRRVGLIRDLTGGPRVMLDAAPLPIAADGQSADDGSPASETVDTGAQEADASTQAEETPPAPPGTSMPADSRSKILFVGHGKNRGPLEKVERFLIKYGIPHKIAVDEPHLGRPIPTKVKAVMRECGAAILIFTKDESFRDAEGTEVWRPSENVVYELGAASLLYDDRIVILMEKGLHFPMNFESIGHIEFDEDQIEAKTSDLLQELIGFGLIKVTVS